MSLQIKNPFVTHHFFAINLYTDRRTIAPNKATKNVPMVNPKSVSPVMKLIMKPPMNAPTIPTNTFITTPYKLCNTFNVNYRQ